MVAAAPRRYLVGLVALRRTGIYFAMITIAIAEVFLLRRVQSAARMDRRENGLPGVPTPSLDLGFTTSTSPPAGRSIPFLAVCYFIGIVVALRIVRSPVGAVLRAIRENPLRAASRRPQHPRYKLTAFVVAAAYAGFAGGLLGVLQAFMPPDAFTFETSGSS
jgi:branched-chain amino acid transport system permease protein